MAPFQLRTAMECTDEEEGPPRTPSTGRSGATPGSAGGSGNARSLEQQFEADFATHLEKASQKRQLRFGALGAGVAGAIGVAASPLLLPGLAVAAVAGGAGGYQWAKRKGRQQLQRHAQSGRGAGDRPTLRRLKYLVKWGHWQLLEYEAEGPSELRTAVLDEVISAFSPWVQRIYLLSAHRGWSPGDCSTEVREVSQHLAPLCLLLQRRAAVKAVEEATEAVGVAALVGALDSKHVARCRIVFPTILETVSFLDRFPAALGHSALFALVGEARGEADAGALDSKARRLRRGAAAIREVLERPDVVQAIANWNGQSRAVAGPPGLEQPGHRPEPLEVPPEGAEDEEPAMCGDGGEEGEALDYYSCSGESEGEGPPTRPAGLERLASLERAGTSLAKRLAALPRGDCEHSWRPFDEATFDIRSATYLADKRKAPAAASLLELVSVDILRIGAGGPILRAAAHGDLYPMHERRKGNSRFFFIQNWVFPPYQAIMVGALDPNAPWLVGAETPQARLWRRFLAMSPEEQRSSFKVIMSVEEGPWLVKRAVPKKPVLIGRQLKMETHHAPGDHLEVVIDVSSGRTEQVATGLVMRGLRCIQLAMASLIEGTREEELPEALLLCASMRGVNTARFACPGDEGPPP